MNLTRAGDPELRRALISPLRLTIWMGFASASVALLGLTYALLMRLLTDIWVPGWTLLFRAGVTG